MARCPECDATLQLDQDEIEEGEFVDCPECGAELEVISVDPLRLEVALDDFEDEEEDDEVEDFDDGDYEDDEGEDWG